MAEPGAGLDAGWWPGATGAGRPPKKDGGTQEERTEPDELCRGEGAHLAALIATGFGCTLKEQEAPPLSGPSEFAKSITVSVSPDILSQDGSSQSRITVSAHAR